MSKLKTVRFAKLIELSGSPQTATLWTKPEQDAVFSKAIQEERVMSVRQDNVGTKRDVGTVGFAKGKRRSYFIFPRKLPYPAGSQVIGINYDLVAPPKEERRRQERTTTASKRISSRPKIRQPPPPPLPKTWEVTIQFTATIEVTRTVEAPTITGAREEALAKPVKSLVWSRATIRPKIVRVQKNERPSRSKN